MCGGVPFVWGKFWSPERVHGARIHFLFRAKMRPTTATDSEHHHLDVRDLEFLHQLPAVSVVPVLSGAVLPCDFHGVPTDSLVGEDDGWSTFPRQLALTPRGSIDKQASLALKHEDSSETAMPQTIKRGKWTRRLVITKQPSSEFYKDEGGKANALEVEVSLVEFDEDGEPARSPDSEFIDIPLRILLFFEDGKRVDDSDQEIFRFVGNEYDAVVIRASTRKASAQFRLEKVSRRKDGKRFRLRIEVDQEQCTANVADLSPIFTNAICVLSKRKHHAQQVDAVSRAREPPLKLLKRDFTRMEEKVDTQVACLTDEIRRLSRHVQLQSELLSKMFMPTTANAISPLLPPENATMEWFLKSGLLDESTLAKDSYPAPLPYFTITDESDERDDAYSSPMSSESSVVGGSSPLTFAEF